MYRMPQYNDTSINREYNKQVIYVGCSKTKPYLLITTPLLTNFTP